MALDKIATYFGKNIKSKSSGKVSSKKHYQDTHNNSLLGRDHSLLTMIEFNAEWGNAKSNNLICFSRDASFSSNGFVNLSSEDNIAFEYALMDVGIHVKKQSANKDNAVAVKKNPQVSNPPPPPSFVQVFIREPCAYSSSEKSELKTSSTKTSLKSIWVYCGCRIIEYII